MIDDWKLTEVGIDKWISFLKHSIFEDQRDNFLILYPNKLASLKHEDF